MAKGAEVVLFSKDRLDMKARGEFISGKVNVSDGSRFLIGADRNNIDLGDSVVAIVIKKEKNE